MNDQEFLTGLAQFFGKHPVGKELKRRWEHRVEQLTKNLIYEADNDKKSLLQAKIQYHREVTQELGI